MQGRGVGDGVLGSNHFFPQVTYYSGKQKSERVKKKPGNGDQQGQLSISKEEMLKL